MFLALRALAEIVGLKHRDSLPVKSRAESGTDIHATGKPSCAVRRFLQASDRYYRCKTWVVRTLAPALQPRPTLLQLTRYPAHPVKDSSSSPAMVESISPGRPLRVTSQDTSFIVRFWASIVHRKSCRPLQTLPIRTTRRRPSRTLRRSLASSTPSMQ